MLAYVLVGNSKRLPGKHLIEVMPGRRLIDIVVDNLLNLGPEVVVYSKYEFEIHVPLIRDESSWILESVLNLLRGGDDFFIFGGDMPLIRKEAIEILLSEHTPGHAVIPRWGDTGYLEPLHGIYTPRIRECLLGAKSLTEGLKNCPHVRFVPAEDMPGETFFNVNTPEDLEALRAIIGGEKS